MTLLMQWRESFLKIVSELETAAPLKAASVSGELKSWTTCLTSALIRSCEALGWQGAGKGHLLGLLPKAGQEYLGIDVMAFAGNPSARWPFPLAAFELENHARDERVAYSLWKVLCLRVALRVVFAYRPDWEHSRHLVTALEVDVVGGMLPEQRAALKGQTMLIIGNRGEGETFPWGYFKFWELNSNLGRFEKA